MGPSRETEGVLTLPYGHAASAGDTFLWNLVEGVGLRFQGLGLRVEGLGLRVEG